MWNFRSKYHKLKFGTDLDLGDMTPPSFDKDAKGLQPFVLCLFITFSSQIVLSIKLQLLNVEDKQS